MVQNFKCFLPILVTLFILFIQEAIASIGDSTPFFYNCKISCQSENCSENGLTILPHAEKYYKQNFLDKLLLWTCEDECQYICMWRTVSGFLERGWGVPQFYGKWPFVRIFGLQEPASVVFSVMNLVTNIHLLQKFRREIKPENPCYELWHIFFLTCINGWIWSTIFHARDFPLTELFDYSSAYSIVLVTLYCLVMRMMHRMSIIFRGFASVIFLAFYIKYFAYLTVGTFSYDYNMKINISTGILSGVGWIAWSFYVRKSCTYYWKILIFYILLGCAMSLELLDFHPIFWTFDAHSLWHLSSIPLSFLLYSFIKDDCKALQKQKELETLEISKKA